MALIAALQPVSAAFNPVVTLVERALGVLTWRETGALVVSQFVGGALGTVTANVMFDVDWISISTHHRASGGHLLGEVVATLGLLIVIFGAARSGRSGRIAVSVGAYLVAAYWFTSSTSFANPAVTVARIFSDTFAGISPTSVAAFIAMQLVGGVLGYAAIRVLFPNAAATPLAPESMRVSGD